MSTSAQMSILRGVASIGFSLAIGAMLDGDRLEVSMLGAFTYLLFSTIAKPH